MIVEKWEEDFLTLNKIDKDLIPDQAIILFSNGEKMARVGQLGWELYNTGEGKETGTKAKTPKGFGPQMLQEMNQDGEDTNHLLLIRHDDLKRYIDFWTGVSKIYKVKEEIEKKDIKLKYGDEVYCYSSNPSIDKGYGIVKGLVENNAFVELYSGKTEYIPIEKIDFIARESE